MFLHPVTPLHSHTHFRVESIHKRKDIHFLLPSKCKMKVKLNMCMPPTQLGEWGYRSIRHKWSCLSCVGSFAVPYVGKTSSLTFIYISFLSMNLKCCWVHVVLGWMKHLWLTDVPICLEQNSVADVLVKFGFAGMQPATVGSVSQDILIGQVRSLILLLCFSRVCILAHVGLMHD